MEVKGITPPYIIFADNFSGHMSIPISEFCEKNQIHLLGLHPNATFALQPLDVAFFRPFKAKWNQLLSGSCDTSPIQVKKSNVCELIGRVIRDNNFKADIISGFRATGLFPLDLAAVDTNKFVQRDQSSRLDQYVFGQDLPGYAKGFNTIEAMTLPTAGK